MLQFYKTAEIISYLREQRNVKTGFVPTMGALHDGHLKLVEKSVHENDLTVVSIFVNPTQFNDPEDLKRYPKTLDQDIEKLQNAGCSVVFNPDNDQIYTDDYKIDLHFGYLEEILEGKYRPGHFNGVGQVVYRLFDIIKPSNAYFGKKDYQQLIIIKKLVEDHQLSINIIPCSTVRESDGLAMSSRNLNLTPEQRKIAPAIYKTLTKSLYVLKEMTVDEVKNLVIEEINSYSEFRLEYFELVNAQNLKKIDTWSDAKHVIGCIALFLGNIRLIDNIEYF